MHNIQAMLGHSSVIATEKHYAQFAMSAAGKRILRALEGSKKVQRKGSNEKEQEVG